MNVGQALQTPSTNLAKAAKTCNDMRLERLAKARELAASEGITLEDAIYRVAMSTTYVAA